MTSKDADDERIKKITEFLEKGGTMLASHHECGAPMFRYQGQVICPVCSSSEYDQKKNTAVKVTEVKGDLRRDTKSDVDKEKGQEKGEIPSLRISEIESIIMKKIAELTKSLENESDHRRIMEELECIEKGLTILKLLKK